LLGHAFVKGPCCLNAVAPQRTIEANGKISQGRVRRQEHEGWGQVRVWKAASSSHDWFVKCLQGG
jgi:hypothetical protein